MLNTSKIFTQKKTYFLYTWSSWSKCGKYKHIYLYTSTPSRAAKDKTSKTAPEMPDMTLNLPTAGDKPEVVGEKVWKGSCVFAHLCCDLLVVSYACKKLIKNPGGTWAWKVHGFSPEPGEFNLWHGRVSHKPRHPTEESLLQSATWLYISKVSLVMKVLHAQKFAPLFW